MRAKEFNRNRALEKCVVLFWNNGYSASPINKLVEVTGVNRSSLYDEFENKMGILLAAIDLYIERYVNPKMEVLFAAEEDEKVLFSFLKSFSENDPKHPEGCFLVAMALELGNDYPEISKKLDDYLKRLKDAFIQVSTQSFEGSEMDIASRADQLIGLYCSGTSMSVVFKQGEMERYFKANLKIILSNNHSNV